MAVPLPSDLLSLGGHVFNTSIESVTGGLEGSGKEFCLRSYRQVEPPRTIPICAHLHIAVSPSLKGLECLRFFPFRESFLETPPQVEGIGRSTDQGSQK